MIDLECIKVKYNLYPGECSGCRVHKGFYRTYLDLRDRVLNAFEKLYYFHPNAEIITTG